MKELINKSVGASVLISLGDYALLKLGNPIGPVIFAFGLLGVCYLGQNLFTGKCGFLFEDKIPLKNLILILTINLLAGYLMGICFSFCDSEVVSSAVNKVSSWDISVTFFLKSIFCGIIMYLAVLMYRRGTPLGIIYGIPLFIFCGFQHCIANIITLGVARTFHWSIILCILGNFLGSLFIWYFSHDFVQSKSKNNTPFVRLLKK